jgi:hypothetical protein
MTIFLSIAFGLSLALILLGFWADRSAVTARINGANGLPILVALVVSFLASLVVAVIAGLLDDWEILGKVLLFTVPCHAALGGLLIWRLQSLATRVKAEEEARSKKFADMFRKPSKPQS